VALPVKLQLAVTDTGVVRPDHPGSGEDRLGHGGGRGQQPEAEGYENCPACAQIDLLKAIPPSVTTFAPGTGFAVTTPAR
jgi:hypothetical protein